VEARGPATHTVTIDASSYQPATLTVRVGDSIVWVNKDLLVHTATTQPGGFDSQAIAPGKSWKYTAKTEGEIAYSCTFHPAMKGTIRVR
jgi:plastocyanin